MNISRVTTLSFSLMPSVLMGSTLKEKNLLLYDQILSLKSSAHFDTISLSSEANRKLDKLFPLLKSGTNSDSVLDLAFFHSISC